MSETLKPRCKWHKPLNLGYIEGQADAMRRAKRGQEQKQCDVCKRWFWSVEFGKPEDE